MTIFIMEQIRLNLAYHFILQPLTRTGMPLPWQGPIPTTLKLVLVICLVILT